MTKFAILPAIAVSLLSVLCTHAEIKLPALISDNMIVQQKSNITLWGWASPGETVTVAASWMKTVLKTTADANGNWKVTVKTGAAGSGYSIRFTAGNSILVNNVALGEVWLASGQSNMEFPMAKQGGGYAGVVNYEEEIQAANYPDIRQIDVPNRVSDEPEKDFTGSWQVCSPSTAGTFSAVAFYFAKQINAAVHVPVGIINATWGGTPAESWTRKAILESDPVFSAILDRYKKQVADYPAAFEKYKSDLDKWKADTSASKGAAPREPMGPKHPYSPYKLYNGMIAPLLAYNIKGVIWYQGEANSGRAAQYRKLFPAMIENWREDFHNPSMPFYFVQISPHMGMSPEVRDAQLFTLRKVPHTGMAVTTDNGDSLNIHPRNKKLVGERLALWALKNDYGEKNIVASGPLYKSMKAEGNKIRVNFDDAAGLIASGDLTEFTIAGADQQFVPAKAVIDGNSVVVSAENVSQPVAVRFAWKNVPHPNLFNAAGLPASPFRTDDWKLTSEGKN